MIEDVAVKIIKLCINTIQTYLERRLSNIVEWEVVLRKILYTNIIKNDEFIQQINHIMINTMSESDKSAISLIQRRIAHQKIWEAIQCHDAKLHISWVSESNARPVLQNAKQRNIKHQQTTTGIWT